MRRTINAPLQPLRVPLVRALLARFRAGATHRSGARLKRRPAPDLKDLDQRVRECGEW